MDKEKLDELIRENTVDNSKLEELMSDKLTAESEMEFLELFKQSQLFMPVTYSPNMFEGIENAKEGDIFEPEGQVGFDINYLTGNDGSKAVPLFTSDEKMEKANCRSSAVAIFMSDLAEMLKKTDRYSALAINPFTEHDIVMPMEVFLDLFHEPTEEEMEFLETLKEILEIMKENSLELEENVAFMLRSDENIMKEMAVDGVFVPNVPFNISSNSKFRAGLKYTNILLFEKGKKVLRIGPPSEKDFDTVVAPGTEFILEKELDEVTTLWKCGAQPFYDN